MTNMEQKEIEKIKADYSAKEKSKLEDLKALDRKVKRPAEIFTYTFGGIGSLVLGAGMCLAMKVIGNSMPLGIVIGMLGIAMVSVNYPLYKKILAKRKKKYAKQVVEMSNKLLNHE